MHREILCIERGRGRRRTLVRVSDKYVYRIVVGDEVLRIFDRHVFGRI